MLLWSFVRIEFVQYTKTDSIVIVSHLLLLPVFVAIVAWICEAVCEAVSCVRRAKRDL